MIDLSKDIHKDTLLKHNFESFNNETKFSVVLFDLGICEYEPDDY